jgi:hypothetical protein
MSNKGKKKATSKVEIIEQGFDQIPTNPVVEETHEEVVENVNSEPLVNVIRVNVSDLNRPIYFVDVTENEVALHPDIYFSDREQAKRYALNELLEVKQKMNPSEYSDAYWFIATFV